MNICDTIKILVVPDFSPKTGSGNYMEQLVIDKSEALIAPLREKIDGADYSLVNVETVMDSGSLSPIKKDGPNLKTDKRAAEFLKYSGFRIALLANNHIGDYGEDGVISTIDELSRAGLEYCGAGKDLDEAEKILYLSKGLLKVAVINRAENEYGIADKDTAGAAPYNVFRIYYDIKKARRTADKVIVILHGGHEHYPIASPKLKEKLRGLVDMGADVVINMHTHCPLGIEQYKDSVIFYGLGNFIFDTQVVVDYGLNLFMAQRGMSAEIEITHDKISHSYTPFVIEDNSVMRLMQGSELDGWKGYVGFLSEILSDDVESENYWKAWCLYKCEMQMDLNMIFTNPLFTKNYLNCESHQELLSSYYKYKIQDELAGLQPYIDKIKKLQKAVI